MEKDKLNTDFIEKMNEIKKEKSIKVNDFKKRYNLDEYELELSEQTKKEIVQSRTEYESGKTHSLKDIKKGF